MRLTECPPCQMGDHKHHYRVVQAAPEEGFGGAICDCEGECVDHGPLSLDAMLGLPEGAMERLVRRAGIGL